MFTRAAGAVMRLRPAFGVLPLVILVGLVIVLGSTEADGIRVNLE
jgi:hypothetical protein